MLSTRCSGVAAAAPIARLRTQRAEERRLADGRTDRVGGRHAAARGAREGHCRCAAQVRVTLWPHRWTKHRRHRANRHARALAHGVWAAALSGGWRGRPCRGGDRDAQLEALQRRTAITPFTSSHTEASALWRRSSVGSCGARAAPEAAVTARRSTVRRASASHLIAIGRSAGRHACRAAARSRSS